MPTSKTVPAALGALVLTVGLTGAAPAIADDPGNGAGAVASMTGADGGDVGTVSYTQQGEDVLVEVMLTGLDASSDFRGLHIHEAGVCDPDDPEGAFMSAGEHWSPEGADHSSHRGDMPSPFFTEGGTAALSFVTDRFTVEEILDGDVAQMLHEDRDNFGNVPDRYVSEKTGEPGPDADTLETGDSGARAACGVVEPVTTDG